VSDNSSSDGSTILRAIRYWLGRPPEMPAAANDDPARANLAGKWPDAANSFLCLGTIDDPRERS
jgi:hypothetical protein